MAQQTAAGQRQHLEIQRLRQARQDLQDELALPPGEHRIEATVIKNDVNQIKNDLSEQQRQMTAPPQQYIVQENFLDTS